MNPLDIIEKYYPKNSGLYKDVQLYKILIDHSTAVTNKALKIIDKHPELKIDRKFVSEAAMLHDIGIFETYAPTIFCFGSHPYIAHGYLGCELLKKEGYPKHALVSERHTGAGLSKEDIIAQDFPVPHRDMLPVSMEEQLICFSDCFFSKTKPGKEKTVGQVEDSMKKYGERSVHQFREWCKMFL